MRFLNIIAVLCKHYGWPPGFWRSMGKREFFAWVDLTHEMRKGKTADDPGSWEGVDEDEWWQQARDRRQRRRGW